MRIPQNGFIPLTHKQGSKNEEQVEDGEGSPKRRGLLSEVGAAVGSLVLV